MSAIQLLDTVAGVRTAKLSRSERPDIAVFRLSVGKRHYKLNVVTRKRAPYLNELPLLVSGLKELARTGVPTLHVPYMPEAMGRAFSEGGWSWFDDEGNFDVRALPDLLLHRRVVTKTRPAPSRLLSGRASIAAIRWLTMTRHEQSFGATELASVLDVSQPRASQLLSSFAERGLLHRSGPRQWAAHREVCLDAFVEHYRGPKGASRYFYSLDAPLDVALHVAGVLPSHQYAVSADVGPDLLAPVRRPSDVVFYLRDEKLLSHFEWTEAKGATDANVVVHVPDDGTVFWSEPAIKVRSQELMLAHPTQMLWDMQQLGAVDRTPAYEAMVQWFLRDR